MGNSNRSFLILLFIIFTIMVTSTADNSKEETPTILTPKAYRKVLRTRRNDQSVLIESMLKKEYSTNYKLISVALDKIFYVIKNSNITLNEESYKWADGFPSEERTQEAVCLLIEDTCLAADLILHFPEMTQKILKKIPNWKETINWCLDFVNHFPHLTNEPTVELLDLARQEINEDARGPDFINPYYTKVDKAEAAPVKKPKEVKKIKKGPQLTSKTEL